MYFFMVTYYSVDTDRKVVIVNEIQCYVIEKIIMNKLIDNSKKAKNFGAP